GIIGPWLITSLREQSRRQAIQNLAMQVDDSRFMQAFGAPLSELETLTVAKTVTIQRLLAIAPSGTPDPAATLYNTTMLVMAGLLAVALIANALIRPVHPTHHLPSSD